MLKDFNVITRRIEKLHFINTHYSLSLLNYHQIEEQLKIVWMQIDLYMKCILEISTIHMRINLQMKKMPKVLHFYIFFGLSVGIPILSVYVYMLTCCNSFHSINILITFTVFLCLNRLLIAIGSIVKWNRQVALNRVIESLQVQHCTVHNVKYASNAYPQLRSTMEGTWRLVKIGLMMSSLAWIYLV